MAKVKNILDKKGRAIFSVAPSVTVYQAIELMCDQNIGGLLIVENDVLTGIFTERDYARKLILKGKSSKDTRIADLMTPNPITVTADTTIEECMQIMTQRKIRHLPVLEEGKLTGMVSIGDVVSTVIDEQKNIIDHLEQYITR
jgi:CBS domain-containing protein